MCPHVSVYRTWRQSISPCDDGALDRARGCSPDARWPIELAVVVLSAYYCKAGIAKLHDGRLAWADGATLQFYLMTNGGPAGMALAQWP